MNTELNGLWSMVSCLSLCGSYYCLFGGLQMEYLEKSLFFVQGTLLRWARGPYVVPKIEPELDKNFLGLGKAKITCLRFNLWDCDHFYPRRKIPDSFQKIYMFRGEYISEDIFTPFSIHIMHVLHIFFSCLCLLFFIVNMYGF